MIFTTTTEYAIRGLAELAGRAGDGRSMMLDDLVSGTTLPRDFLAKVFQRLVKAGLLDASAAPVLDEIRAYNPLLFDFVQKRHLRSGTQSLGAVVFDTRRHFRAATA